MKNKIENFMSRNDIDTERIMYIIREESKTCIYISDGRRIESYFSIKRLTEVIGNSRFVTVNKGVLVSLNFVSNISDGNYEMTDGKILKGRVRTPGEHKRNKIIVRSLESVGGIPSELVNDRFTEEQIEEKFSILDDLPLPFAVFEIKYEKEKPVDIFFKYLNKKMAEMAESTVEATRGRSFYDVFENGDRKWIEINEEVVVTGEARAVRRFSPEVGKYLSLYYFSPISGYCACVVV